MPQQQFLHHRPASMVLPRPTSSASSSARVVAAVCGALTTSGFDRLIASGWHTGGIFMRLFADHYLSRVASLASSGIDELRWPVPVRPGDRLRLGTTTTETRRSRSKPDRGLVFTHAELLNADDSVVLSLKAMNLLRLRRSRD